MTKLGFFNEKFALPIKYEGEMNVQKYPRAWFDRFREPATWQAIGARQPKYSPSPMP